MSVKDQDLLTRNFCQCTSSTNSHPLLVPPQHIVAPRGAFVNHFASARRFRTHAHGRGAEEGFNGGEAPSGGHWANICICAFQRDVHYYPSTCPGPAQLVSFMMIAGMWT